MRTPQAHNALHGITLEAMITALVDHYRWEGIAERIRVQCFTNEPSVTSSLKFLRKTPWAREKVEHLYTFMLRERAREARALQGEGDVVAAALSAPSDDEGLAARAQNDDATA